MRVGDAGWCGFVLAIAGLVSPVLAQVPVDAASDRRAGRYAYFQSFGAPATPFINFNDVGVARARSSRFFGSVLATCELGATGCDADVVYALADRFCQALEFDEAVTWRLSRAGNTLILHWSVCGLKS